MTDKVYDPTMSVAVGLMLYNFEETKKPGNKPGSGTGILDSIFATLKKIFKVFLP